MKMALTMAFCAALVVPVGLAGPVTPGAVVIQADTNGVSLNRIATNRLAANALVQNRLAANKLAANKLSANKLAANKLALNKLSANRLAANKLAANASVFGDATPLVTVRGITLADGRSVAVDPGL